MEQMVRPHSGAIGTDSAVLSTRSNLRGPNATGSGDIDESFDVWQFRMHHRHHLMGCAFFISMGLLRALATQELPASLAGTLLISAIFAPIRHAAHLAKNQALAHLVLEYFAFSLLAIRLIMVNFAVPDNSFEPLETCLQACGWDILRPVAMSIVLSMVPMRQSFVIIINILYASRLAATIDTFLSAHNLMRVEDSIFEWGVRINSMLPVYVFAVSLFAYSMSIRQSRSLYEHMMQLQGAHREEVLAKEHAIRCEHRALEAERQTADERLQQRNRYLGAMCHDFGTPVSVLQMLLLMMRKRVMRDRTRKRQEAAAAAQEAEKGAAMGDGDVEREGEPKSSASANSAARSLECFEDSARMLDLVRRASAGLELLELTRQKAIAFSKLQAGGTLVPDCKPFEMAELMRKSASIARDTRKSERVTVHTQTSAELPLVVETDANWIFMILVNFASNSMKHTRQGSVTITAERVGQSHLRFEVSDTGCGVPAEFVPSLFQPFSSASTTAPSVESTGLGLYHSKQLAEILSGSVGYRPNAGGGATFYVEVPMKLVTAARAKKLLAKNRSELAGFEDVATAPHHAGGESWHERSVPCAATENGVSGAPVPAAAIATTAAAPSAATTCEGALLHGSAAAVAGRNVDAAADNAVGSSSDALGEFDSNPRAASSKMPISKGVLDAAAASSEKQSSGSPPSFSQSLQLFSPCSSPPPPSPDSILPLSPPSSPQPLPSLAVQQTRRLTVSHHWASSVLLTSLLSELPPPLIVDASELSRNVMREQLYAWAGVLPVEAESGEEALSMLTAEQQLTRVSSVLLADYVFGLDGCETCRAIRMWEQSRGVAQTERLRIVGLLTLSNDAAGRAACLDAGMDDAIAKPFNAATLYNTLQKLLL